MKQTRTTQPAKRCRQPSDTPAEPPAPGAAEERIARNHEAVTAAVAERVAMVRAAPSELDRRPAAERANEGGASADGGRWEYLDHTADVQLHASGPTLEVAMGALGQSLFGYMTDLERVEPDDARAQSFEVRGHDLPSLLFAFLDELLFRFAVDGVVCCEVRVDGLARGGSGASAAAAPPHQAEAEPRGDDAVEEGCVARVRTRGEAFDLAKHPQGTEVKAITYSNMQIHERPDQTDLYVIVDI